MSRFVWDGSTWRATDAPDCRPWWAKLWVDTGFALESAMADQWISDYRAFGFLPGIPATAP